MLAFCSNRKLVTRAMTPVLSRPITVMVANFFMELPLGAIAILEAFSDFQLLVIEQVAHGDYDYDYDYEMPDRKIWDAPAIL